MASAAALAAAAAVQGMIVAFSTFETMKEVLGVGADAGAGADTRELPVVLVTSQHAVGLEEDMECGILNE